MLGGDMPNIEKKNLRGRAKDIKELEKLVLKKIINNTPIELIAYSTGFFLSLNDPVLGYFSSQVTYFILQNFKNIIDGGDIFEALKGIYPEEKFESVGQFWSKIDDLKLEHGALIEIKGLISPYAPIIPAHPLSRPGFSVEGWEAMGDLDTKDSEDYDLQDSLIYGDRVIRLPKSAKNRYYGGLYDYYYGQSSIGLPLFIDKMFVTKKKYSLSTLWEGVFSAGRLVIVKGNLIKLKNPYTNFIKQLPQDCIDRPNFGLEVKDIILSEPPKGVTHVSTSVVWNDNLKNEKMLAHYFNVQNTKQIKSADLLLQEERDENKDNLVFDYDDLRYLSPKFIKILPEYNEMLREWLEEK